MNIYDVLRTVLCHKVTGTYGKYTIERRYDHLTDHATYYIRQSGKAPLIITAHTEDKRKALSVFKGDIKPYKVLKALLK